MSDPIKLPKFTKDGAVEEIRRIAKEDSSKVIVLDHAKIRMMEREITSRQIYNVLKNGEPKCAPEWDTEQEKGWKCRLSRVTAGTAVTVVAKLVERDENVCLIVTVF